MRKTNLNLKIFLSPVLCVVVYLFFIQINLFEYYPIFFGLIIGLINKDSLRYKPLIGVLLSAVLSFLSFVIAYFSLSIFGFLREFLLNNTDYVISDDSMRSFGFIISPFVLAPLLVFLSFIFIFNVKKTKKILIVVLSSITLLVLIAVLLYKFQNVDPYLFWQIIVAITIQLMVNEKHKLKKA